MVVEVLFGDFLPKAKEFPLREIVENTAGLLMGKSVHLRWGTPPGDRASLEE